MRDSDGHGFEAPSCAESEMLPDNWQSCSAYARGIDLFNHGYYWESHECWENVWNRVGRRGLTADFMKALIKIAAARNLGLPVIMIARPPSSSAGHATVDDLLAALG